MVKPKGYVYFVHAPGSNMVKIGYSARWPDHRLAELRAMSPVPLIGLGHLSGRIADEQALHYRFEEERSHGEWFRGSERLMKYIRLNAAPWEYFPNHLAESVLDLPVYAAWRAIRAE